MKKEEVILTLTFELRIRYIHITQKYLVRRILMNISSQILGSLSPEDLEGIKAWTFNLTVEEEDLLTEAGRQELKQLGERYKKRLPSLINLSAKVCLFN